MRKKSEKKDSKNEFELDMDSSLNNIIGNLSNQQKLDQMNVSAEEDDKFAEAVEEDTDSEEEDATGKRVTKKRQHFTNDELFYDPKMDDDDEKWINKQRVTYERRSLEHVTSYENICCFTGTRMLMTTNLVKI